MTRHRAHVPAAARTIRAAVTALLDEEAMPVELRKVKVSDLGMEHATLKLAHYRALRPILEESEA